MEGHQCACRERFYGSGVGKIRFIVATTIFHEGGVWSAFSMIL
jgi:hypothetical protein